MNLNRYTKYAVIFLVIFFIYGLRGLLDPHSRDQFISLFPLALLLSITTLLLFTDKISLKYSLVLIIIALAGFLIEAAGVHTKFIFGDYTYGDTLGIKVFNTPLIIGLNWAMLVFATSSITEQIRMPSLLKVLTGASLMVLYDVLLEIIAPVTGMWTWKNGVAPLRNYLAWFVISFLLHLLVRFFKVETRSAMAIPVLIIHAVFFIFLIIIS